MNIKDHFSKLTHTHWAIILFCLHLVLGLVFCFVVFPQIGDITSGLDPDGYGQTGRDLYESGRFESLSKAPLYPAFVALVSWLAGGYKLWAIQAAQCLLSACTIVIFYTIFRRTLENEGIARTAGVVCALFPLTLWYIPRLWTETFLTFTLALFTLAMARLLQNPDMSKALLCGLAAGVVALSKGIALVFTPLGLVIVLFFLRKREAQTPCGQKSGETGSREIVFYKPAWGYAALFCLGALALVAPWTWRNWQLSGVFLPIHADGGYNFYLGNGFTRHWLESPFSYIGLKALTVEDQKQAYEQAGISVDSALKRDKVLMAAARQEIKAQPTLLIDKLMIQSLTFWYLAADFPKSVLTGVLQIPLVLLALPGIISALKRRSWAILLLAPVVGVMGVSVLVFAFARLSVTIMPYMIGLAAYTWVPRFYTILPLRLQR